MLEVVKDFIITKIVLAIFPTYGKHGELMSIVIETEKIYLVTAKPLDVIRHSIEFYGGSLEGALAASKKVMGNIDMPPIQISSALGLYWFPTKSPFSDDCVWFAVDHVDKAYPYTDEGIKVRISNGLDVPVESSYSKFDRKFNRANTFKNTMEKRNRALRFYNFPKMQIQIVKDPIKGDYIIKQKKRTEGST